MTKGGGAYIPPARLRMMQQQIEDKSSVPYQRMAWNALKKSLNGHINKVAISNIQNIVLELFEENLVRGRGLFARAVMKAQASSPTFTHVYAALVAVVNTKFPQIGELILKRVILQFRNTYRRNSKATCLVCARFIAHLVNQQVAHEVVALEMLTLLLDRPTNDSVEVAIAFLKEVGQYLNDVSPRGLHAIFEQLRSVLHEGAIDKRVQYMVEVMYAVRKDGFVDYPTVVEGLDLVESQDQITHMVGLDEEIDQESILDVFKADPEYVLAAFSSLSLLLPQSTPLPCPPPSPSRCTIVQARSRTRNSMFWRPPVATLCGSRFGPCALALCSATWRTRKSTVPSRPRSSAAPARRARMPAARRDPPSRSQKRARPGPRVRRLPAAGRSRT